MPGSIGKNEYGEYEDYLWDFADTSLDIDDDIDDDYVHLVHCNSCGNDVTDDNGICPECGDEVFGF